MCLLAIPFIFLPLRLPADWSPTGNHPIISLLAMLTASVGVPFFAVSTSGPLLQKWFTSTGHRAAIDPYFLYAASNLGSLLALVSYPFVVEPVFRVSEQERLWTIGYGHLCDSTHPPITREEGEFFLAKDLVVALNATLRALAAQ